MNNEQKRTLWSPLPHLRWVDGRHTQNPSDSDHRLANSQVTEWSGFEKEVLQKMKQLGTPPNNLTPYQPQEYFIVGNETGLQGRLIEHLAQSLGPMFDGLKLGVSLTDFQVGQTIDQAGAERAESASKGKQPEKQHVEGKGENDGTRSVPDFVLLTNNEYTFCVMFEVKTFWTFVPKKNQSEAQYVTVKLGQLARYMDDTKCRYGVLTTHDKTWFVRRASPDIFAVSKGIFAGQTATSEVPSLQQCLLYISWLASDEKRAYTPGIFGDDLTQRPNQGTRESKRRKTAHWQYMDDTKEAWDSMKSRLFPKK